MKIQWFKRNGALFLPASFIGWVVLLAAVAYLVWKFIDIDSRSHSASDTLMNFAFQALIVAAAYLLIAFSMSSRNEQ